MKLPDVKYAIPDQILDDTVEALQAVETRFEQEAAALLRVDAGRELAEKRLAQAKKATELVDFYLGL